jgi:hypothetical protein
MANETVYASQDVTVHKTYGRSVQPNGQEVEDVTAVVLSAGESLPLSDLASYQQDSVKEGKVAGLEVLSDSEAAKRREEVQRFQAMVTGAGVSAAPTTNVLGPTPEDVVVDVSFSDHHVSDAERVANHAAAAAELSGESGDDSKVTVAGAEKEISPANAGRVTDPDLVQEKVQGSAGADAAVGKDEAKAAKKKNDDK